MSISHWGMFEGAANPMQPPLTWICEICRLKAALDQLAKPTGRMLSGRAIQLGYIG
jgi:hypothetical protein